MNDSWPDTKYKINHFNSRASLRRPNEKKKLDIFLLTLAFIPSDGRSLSLSLVPDQLIGTGNGVMVTTDLASTEPAVSRTFAWWSTCTLRAIRVCTKRSHCPSSSCTHSYYHVRAGALGSTNTFNLVHSAHATKMRRGAAGTMGINMVSLTCASHSLRKDKR